MADWFGVDMHDVSVAERFWAKVEKTEACWLWRGARRPSGYGNFKLRSYVTSPAHRVAWELARGPIPNGLHIDHLCRNPSCVNPSHLEPVTPQENWRRGISPTAVNRRKVLCDRGHLIDAVRASGYRACRTCHADNERVRRASQEACSRGHEFDRVAANGMRRCSRCDEAGRRSGWQKRRGL